MNNSSHGFETGEEYLKCRYLELIDTMPKKGFYRYRRVTKRGKSEKFVFIDMKHVFCPSVNISTDLKLSLEEYQFLADCNM